MPVSRGALTKRAKPIKLIAMDVDGVLTSGDIVVLKSGEEIKFWNAKDRLILASLSKRMKNLTFAWITGRSSKAVEWAARDLGVSYVVQGSHNKKEPLEKIMKKEKLKYDQVAFIGDDLIDLGPLKRVGFAACPKDAASDVLENVHYVSPYLGGKGVARDVIEFILKAQKKWDPFIKPFLS